MDARKQVDYWHSGAKEDLAARSLDEKGHRRHALFFAHLAIEKALKAHLAQATGGVPPRTHDLLRLASMAGLCLSDDRRQFLAAMQQYCLEGRYPDVQPDAPLPEDVRSRLRLTEEVFSWLASLLK